MSSEDLIYQSFKLKSGVQLSTRVIMGSMHIGLEEMPDGNEKLAAFYRLRARGGAGLIVTGGISPNEEGVVMDGGARLDQASQVDWYRPICEAVHAEGGKICLQILHTGRYAISTKNVAPSALRAPINPFKPKALTPEEIERTIQDFIRTAQLAEQAGYDGVEIMGSEGYLINQFGCLRTNHREDEWGGPIENRTRLAGRIVEGVRNATRPDFILMYRQSMLDLVEGGNSWEEVVYQTKTVCAAGADLINTGIGWHEARIPTIAGVVPGQGFLWVTAKMKNEIDRPIIATNRFNDLDAADEAISNGKADFVSMARPFLSDPELVNKSRKGKSQLVNTCIACNQACLDHIFQAKPASCLVNPEAGRETEKSIPEVAHPRKIAVVGAGPGGLSFASFAARAGHKVSLYDQSSKLGGQFNEAAKIPGKEVYLETIRYYRELLKRYDVDVHLNSQVKSSEDLKGPADVLVWAAGVRPRIPEIPGVDDPAVCTYRELLRGQVSPGKKIAIVGGGGIGTDVSHFLYHRKDEDFYDFWGIDQALSSAGGLKEPEREAPDKDLTVFMRSTGKLGGALGKTTGWIHRLYLRHKGLKLEQGVQYDRIENGTLYYTRGEEHFSEKFDQIVLCAGQESLEAPTFEGLQEVHCIGGARKAGGLDAQRAIEEAFVLVQSL